MRTLLTAIGTATWILAALAQPWAAAARESAQACTYTLGFATLHDLIPGIVGDCKADAAPRPNGDVQQVTANGLLVWRKADNWTAFTNGERTWVNGPCGLQERGNAERFPWESGGACEGEAESEAARQLRNAEAAFWSNILRITPIDALSAQYAPLEPITRYSGRIQVPFIRTPDPQGRATFTGFTVANANYSPVNGSYRIALRWGQFARTASFVGSPGSAELLEVVQEFHGHCGTADYCTHEAFQGEGAETFGNLTVNGAPALARHDKVSGSSGGWVLWWYDDADDVTYSIVTFGDLSTWLGGADLRPENLAVAQTLVDEAEHLLTVRLGE